MIVTKKQTTTTLNIKSTTEQSETELLQFVKKSELELHQKSTFLNFTNFEVLDSDEDSNYFYYTVTYDTTELHNEFVNVDGNEVSARTFVPKKKRKALN